MWDESNEEWKGDWWGWKPGWWDDNFEETLLGLSPFIMLVIFIGIYWLASRLQDQRVYIDSKTCQELRKFKMNFDQKLQRKWEEAQND